MRENVLVEQVAPFCKESHDESFEKMIKSER